MLSTRFAAALSFVLVAATLSAQQPRTREPEKRMEAVERLKLAQL